MKINKEGKTLEASEKRYRRLFETAQDGILIVDFETGQILDANQFLIDILGYSKADFLEKYLWEVGFFKDVVASKEKFLELQTKKYARFENLPLKTKEGKIAEVEFIANAYRENGIWVIQCNIRDISDRKRIEEEHTKDLEKMNKFMVGREIKMSELKEKIKKLEDK